MHSQGLDSHHDDHDSDNENTHDDMPTRNALIGWLFAYVIISLIIFVSNLATILTFYKKKRLRRRGVYCLVNLAVADMIHGFFSMCWFTMYLDYIGIDFLPFKLIDSGLKLAAGLVNTSTLVLSLLCLVLVSLDRVYATFYPFSYRSIRLRTYIFAFAITWATAFLLAMVPSFFLEFNIYSHDLWFDKLHFVCLTSLAVIIAAYIATFFKIRLQNLSNQKHTLAEAVQRRQQQERHLAITLLIVTMLSLTTWLPFIINHEVDIVSRLPPGPGRHYLELSTELIQLTNSLVNPVVYLFRLKEFRKALLQQFFGKCSNQVEHFDNGIHGYCVRRNRVQSSENQSSSNKCFDQTKAIVVNIAKSSGHDHDQLNVENVDLDNVSSFSLSS